MKLIAGLGNPGLGYRETRHNLGFMVIDEFSRCRRVRLRRDITYGCLKAYSKFKGADFVLCKPLSYMNASGVAIAKLALKNKLALEDMLVICDDINLELGRIRIKARGGSGGHKGLESIIGRLGSEAFARLRIGIACPVGKEELSDYVLLPFKPEEKKMLSESIKEAVEAALYWLENGTSKTMNKFNPLRWA